MSGRMQVQASGNNRDGEERQEAEWGVLAKANMLKSKGPDQRGRDKSAGGSNLEGNGRAG